MSYTNFKMVSYEQTMYFQIFGNVPLLEKRKTGYR